MNNNFKNRIVFSKYKKYFEGEKYNLNHLISLTKDKPKKFKGVLNYACNNINSFNYDEIRKIVKYLIKTDQFDISIFDNADNEHKTMIIDIFDNKKDYNYGAMFSIYNYIMRDFTMQELYLDKAVQISLKYTNNIECLLKFAKKAFDNEKVISIYTGKIEELLNVSFDNDTKEIDIDIFKKIVRFYSVYMGKRKTELQKIYIKAIPYYINRGISNRDFSYLLSLIKDISNMEILFDEKSKESNTDFINEVKKTLVKTKNKNYIALYIYENIDYELMLQIFGSYKNFVYYSFFTYNELETIKQLDSRFHDYIHTNHFTYVDDKIDNYLNDKTQNKLSKY